MNECAPETAGSASFEPASIELRRAQRAFSALLGSKRTIGEFRDAQLRSHARRTLSALSADDRRGLADWLTLLLAADGRMLGESMLGVFARIDTWLAARVRRALPLRVEALAIGARANHVVAA